MRASPIDCSRFFGFLVRQRCSSCLSADGVSGGSYSHSGSRSRIFASVSVTVSPSNMRLPVSIRNRTTPKAQMSVRRSTSRPRACSGDMYGGGAHDDAGAGRRCDHRRRHRQRDIGRLGADRLGQTEVQHLHLVVGGDLDVGRLEVAVDDSRLVRLLEPFGDLLAIGSASPSGIAPRRIRSSSVSPGTSSITRKWRPSLPRRRRWRRRLDDSATPARALRAGTAPRGRCRG